MDWFIPLITNPFLITGISSWLIAQVLKTIIHAIITKEIDFSRLFGDGGMPSGHAATVTSTAVMCALLCGTGSAEFAIAAILAIVVCHDATGVRQETGKQAVLLNELIDMFHSSLDKELLEIKLKKFVGHTPLQVLTGIVIGTANAFVMHALFFS